MQTGEKSDLRPYLLLKLLLETGIKKSECINIKLNHINSETKNPLFSFDTQIPKIATRKEK